MSKKKKLEKLEIVRIKAEIIFYGVGSISAVITAISELIQAFK
nr:MAG TPA: hypothetical protein [Caudoviricetes sp.]DAX13287.1 MAG TPA: hypothetical protein [Bacteriophage sp.]